MDALTEEIPYDDTPAALSYDEGITYEDQVAALPAELPRSVSSGLATRISSNKVYLPPESISKGKRKRGDDADELMDEDEAGENADGLRPNALYLRGSPITHLPTNNIFAYARHFNVDPVGLEWIDDSSCVLVFPTNATCRAALEAFRRVPGEEPDFDDCVSARPVPIILWPAGDRINKTLGVAEGLEGPLSVRIARTIDRKVLGAKLHSVFYQKHGMDAGKDPDAHAIGRAPENGIGSKRRRVNEDEDEERRQLDEELDGFLREETDQTPSPLPSPPPSKMRSDYLTDDGREMRGLPGRSLLDRTSLLRAHFDSDASAERPSSRYSYRRQGGGRGRRRKEWDEEESILPPSRRRRDDLNMGGRTERPKKTLQELDDELDAFLNGDD